VIIKTILKEIEKFTKQPTGWDGYSRRARLPRGEPMFKFQLGDLPTFSVRRVLDGITKKEKKSQSILQAR
jgi:hypothetical protein